MTQTHTSYEFSNMLKEFLGESAPEPLAVLADRKGTVIGGISRQKDGWVINIDLPHIYDCECIVAPTYALAEAKARAYLMAFEDKEGA